MYFEKSILTIVFKNAKLSIKKKQKKTKQKKKQPRFSKFGVGWKGQTNIFFLRLIVKNYDMLLML